MAALVVIILLLIALGIPVIGSMGLASSVQLLFQPGVADDPTVASQQMLFGLNSFTLTAIPLFILAGEILFRSGGAGKLVRFVNSMVGWLPGGLGISAVISTMIFSGLSGSVNADAAAIGSVMVPPMVAAGYRREWAASIVAAAAGTGILIPPSITMIVLATLAHLSPQRLFLAALVPAVVVAVSKTLVIYSKARFFDASAVSIPFSPREVLVSFWEALPALLAPVIILGGILTGKFSPTEAAAVAVVYSVLLALLYRTIKWSWVKEILVTVGRLSGIVLSLVAVAQMLGFLFAYNQVGAQLGQFLGGFLTNHFVFIALLILVFWVVGALLDGLPALVILIPFFITPQGLASTSLIDQAGLNPYHFAILSLAIIGISLITPPLGTACFILSGISRTTINRMIVPMAPFIAILLVTMVLLAYVPEFSLWLPTTFDPVGHH